MKKRDLCIISYIINIIIFFGSFMFLIIGGNEKVGQILLCFALAMILITFVIETD